MLILTVLISCYANQNIIVFLIEFAMALMLLFLNDFSISDSKVHVI